MTIHELPTIDDILARVDQVASVEGEKVASAAPVVTTTEAVSQVGDSLRKIAHMLRNADNDALTYDDLKTVMELINA